VNSGISNDQIGLGVIMPAARDFHVVSDKFFESKLFPKTCSPLAIW